MEEEAQQDLSMYCSEWFVAVCAVSYEKATDNVTDTGKAKDWPMEHTCRSVPTIPNPSYYFNLNEFILEDCIWLYIDKGVHKIFDKRRWRPRIGKQSEWFNHICVCLRE